MQTTNETYPVRWIHVWKSFSKYMSISIVVPLLIFVFIRYVKSGSNFSKTFEHLSPLGFCLLLLGICVFSAVFALFAALWHKMATITVSNGMVQGRNSWRLKNRIPLDDIHSMDPYGSQTGSMVVNSRYHGHLYISDQTERLEELLDCLSAYIPNGEGIEAEP